MHGGDLSDTAFNLRQTMIDKGFPDPILSNSGAEVNDHAIEAASYEYIPPVPRPIPVYGLASAFGLTRRLRR